MTDIADTVEQARIAAETEASKEITQQAAPDNPNPETDVGDQRSEIGSQADDPSSDLHHPSSEAAEPLQRITAFDRGRADIAARFRDKRAAQGGHTDYHGDHRDPSQTYGGFGLPPEPTTEDGGQTTDERASEVSSDPSEPAPAKAGVVRRPSSDADQQRLIRVKVHGHEALLPEADVIAEAQKSLAAGNLLETAKEFLQGAKQTTDDGRRRAEDSAASAHPSSVGAWPRESGAPPSSESYDDLVHSLQLGEPKEAGRRLQQTIESKVAAAREEAAREAARAVRLDGELASSQRALAAFEQANPDLAGDEFARDAITTQIQREINADLQAALKSGVLADLPRTQEERNGLHTQLRAFGAPVRGIADIMETAKSKYASWRGDQPAPINQTPSHPLANPFPLAGEGRVGAPRVELSPDRVQRRAAIANQPSRASMPPRPTALPPEPSQAQKRSAAVMAMRKARGQVTA